MLMFSLAGIPPLAGFFAKWYVFVAAIEAKLYGLAVIGVLTSAVGAYYYLRIVKVMYFDEPREAFVPASATLKTVMGVSGIFIVAFWLWPAPLVAAARLRPSRCSDVSLSDAALAVGYRIDIFERIGSTNDEAMLRARQGDPGRLWIVAREQKQGRGRQRPGRGPHRQAICTPASCWSAPARRQSRRRSVSSLA